VRKKVALELTPNLVHIDILYSNCFELCDDQSFNCIVTRGEGFKRTLIEDAIGRLFGSSPPKGFLARRDAEVGQSVTPRGCKSSISGRCDIRLSDCNDVLVKGDLGI
jgi:hypothetical protein